MSFNYNHYLKGLKVGDQFVRLLKATQSMVHLRVTRVTPETIESGTWIFDKKTGGELDLRMKWEPREGSTGSYIRPPVTSTDRFPPLFLKSFQKTIIKDEDDDNPWGEYPWW